MWFMFLTFNRPDMTKENKVGYLKVKVDLLVPNDVFTATSLATPAIVAKQQQNVSSVGMIKMKSSVMDSKYALTPMVLTRRLPKIGLSGRRKRRVNAFALKRKQHIFFPEARQLVKAKSSSTVFSLSLSFANTISERKSVKSVVCQTDLTWVSSDTPMQTVSFSVVTISIRPGLCRPVPSLPPGSQARLRPTPGNCGQEVWVSRCRAHFFLQVPDLTPGIGSGSSSKPRAPTDGARSGTSAPRRRALGCGVKVAGAWVNAAEFSKPAAPCPTSQTTDTPKKKGGGNRPPKGQIWILGG